MQRELGIGSTVTLKADPTKRGVVGNILGYLEAATVHYYVLWFAEWKATADPTGGTTYVTSPRSTPIDGPYEADDLAVVDEPKPRRKYMIGDVVTQKGTAHPKGVVCGVVSPTLERGVERRYRVAWEIEPFQPIDGVEATWNRSYGADELEPAEA